MKTKRTIADINWAPEEVYLDLIDKTPNNYKLKTELGQARFQASLGQFGLAGTVIVLPYKLKDSKKYGVEILNKNCNDDGERYLLIDGNSRYEKALEAKMKKIHVSSPDVYLTPKQFKEMSAIYDYAKAGEVDVDRINGELGTTKEFYERFNMEVPMHLIDKIGKRQDDLDYGGKAKSNGSSDITSSEVRMVQLIFDKRQEELFRKWEPTLHKKFKTDNITDMIFKALQSIVKS